MTLYCATGNPGKLREFRMASPHIQPLLGVPPCQETGATFEENAVQKALYYSPHAEDGILFADDSGLEVEALGNAPGIFSARYAGEGASNRENNELLLRNLQGVKNRKARFVCVVALARRGKLVQTFRGEVEGEVLEELRGEHGFGYDPLFFYPPFGKSFGEIPDEDKFSVSHRGIALTTMLNYLKYQ
jgi:XTP/dITP diphosphohydrolase